MISWSRAQCLRALPSDTARSRMIPRCTNPDHDSAKVENATYKVISGIAAAGCIETCYLTLSKFLNRSVVCFADGCDSVLASGYSEVYGVPLSLIGFLGYSFVILFAQECTQSTQNSFNKTLLLSITSIMASSSALLLWILVTKLDGAFCSWCYLSAGLSFTMFVISLTTVQKEERMNVLMPGSAMAFICGLALLTVFNQVDEATANDVVLEYQDPLVTTQSDRKKISLAKQLRDAGVQMYGAFWCNHCYDQKQTFGKEAMKYFPYVECYPDGYQKGVKVAAACEEAEIEGYPTWVFGDHQIPAKSQKKISKQKAQTQIRKHQLLNEYRSLRNSNAFIDLRGKPDHGTRVFEQRANSETKKTKAQRFSLGELGASELEQNMGLATSIPYANGVSSKNKQIERLEKFKQARAEHIAQVEEDKALLAKVDEEFDHHRNVIAFRKMNQNGIVKSEKDDDQFNNYLMLFSVPNTTPLQKVEDEIPYPMRINPAIEEFSDLEEIIDLDPEDDNSLELQEWNGMWPESQNELNSLMKNLDSLKRVDLIRDLPKLITEMNPSQQPLRQKELLSFLVGVFSSNCSFDLEMLDILSLQISELGHKFPEFLYSIAKQEIRTINQRMNKRPFLGEILMLKIFLDLFPMNENFHPIASSAVILFCQWLIEMPLETNQDLLICLFISGSLESILNHQFCPEILSSYSRLLQSIFSIPLENKAHHEMMLVGVSMVDLLAATIQDEELKIKALYTCLHGIQNLAEKYDKAVCFPELFCYITSLLSEVKTQEYFPHHLQLLTEKLISSLKTQILNKASSRFPMIQSISEEQGIQQRNPVFEEDMDFEETKKWKSQMLSDRRTLKQKLKKEKRGAIKELRKDGLFLSQVREEDKRQVDEQRAQNEKEFFTELRRFDADIKQGGQTGMNPHLKNKSQRLWKY